MSPGCSLSATFLFSSLPSPSLQSLGAQRAAGTDSGLGGMLTCVLGEEQGSRGLWSLVTLPGPPRWKAATLPLSSALLFNSLADSFENSRASSVGLPAQGETGP